LSRAQSAEQGRGFGEVVADRAGGEQTAGRPGDFVGGGLQGRAGFPAFVPVAQGDGGGRAADLVHQTLDAGHFMAEEAPEQITEILRGLLKR
jgi:hypothetical protein